jgi:hypothetical protein
LPPCNISEFLAANSKRQIRAVETYDYLRWTRQFQSFGLVSDFLHRHPKKKQKDRWNNKPLPFI